MLLTPTELERLTIFTAAELARRRRLRGQKLNRPEAIAFIADELLEAARDGQTLAAVMSLGATLLTTDDVLPGVATLIPLLTVEGQFLDGPKMISVHEPIRAGKQAVAASPRPGEVLPADGDIEINAGRARVTILVLNTGDRPIQVASHFHFFEANKELRFDRAASFGMRLDVMAGGVARFEPGESKEVTLVAIGGSGEITGLNNLTEGSIHDPAIRQAALANAKARGFLGAA
ncbi:MAG: urease subunit beta [Dongiaceae bacterium]